MKMTSTFGGTAAVLSTLALAVLSTNAAQAANLNPTFSLDANVELDTDAIDSGAGSTEYSQGGRVEANLRGEIRSEQYFVRGKGTLILAKDSDTHTDDMWVQFGQDRWDLQFGRFEGIDLFPKGKDTLVVHAGGGLAQVYEANLVRGRAGTDGGQIALHLQGDSGLRFELNTLFGDDNVDGTDEDAVSGARPVIVYEGDGFSARLGYEYQQVDLIGGGEIEKEGFGAGATFSLGEALVNLNAAWLDDQTQGSNVDEVRSYGANVIYGRFGAGLIYSETELAIGPDPDVTTAYAAYTLPLFDIDNASVTFAVSGSTADNVGVDDSATGVRMRLNYTF
ncbi:carbohydrate porin [Marinobacterium aestuariivivens]|uniref:Carbohydrate porin n=1 Tax=Marinobacterium aestuariivivens TaxID=1698799 RepID=A0ABW2A6I8_9GAMM